MGRAAKVLKHVRGSKSGRDEQEKYLLVMQII